MTSPGGGQQSRREIADLQRRQETPPLLPDGEPLLARGAKVEVVDSVPVADQRRTAAPVYDLAALAGALGESRRRLSAGDEIHHAPHALDKRTFATRVAGCSQLPLVSPAE